MISVDYDRTGGRFLVQCHPAMNAVVRKLPNRRFSNKANAWLVPAIAANVRSLGEIRKQFKDVTKVTPLADEELSRDRTQVVQREKFPLVFPFQTKPMEHQIRALDKVWSLTGAALFMEPGTGKSKIAIDWISGLFMAGKINSAVIFCPVSLKQNWLEQFLIHCPMPTRIWLQGNPLSKGTWEAETGPISKALEVFVCGTESLSLGIKKGRAYDDVYRFCMQKNPAMVVDESHLIKTHDAIRTKNVHSLGKLAARRLVLTGTPITQGIMDLFSQFEFLDPDILGIGDYYSFRNRYAIMGGYENKQITGYQNVEELTQLVAPYCFECRKKDALDLPEKIYQRRYVEMTSVQEKAYKQMKRDKMTQVTSKGQPLDVVVTNILTVYQHLQTIASGFLYTEDEEGRKQTVALGASNPKVQELCHVIEELPRDAQVIIWARFKEEIRLVSQALEQKGHGRCSLRTGEMSEDEKKAHEDMFHRGETRFFVSSQSAGGTGLTLNEASHTIYFSNTFSSVDRIQSEDRNHRIGQKNAVTYIDLVARGTVDEHILKAVASKMELADYVRRRLADGQDPL